MPDWKSQFIFLILGGISFCAAVVWTCIGKARSRFGWVYRTEEPTVFWLVVTIYYIAAVFFLGNSLYKIN